MLSCAGKTHREWDKHLADHCFHKIGASCALKSTAICSVPGSTFSSHRFKHVGLAELRVSLVLRTKTKRRRKMCLEHSMPTFPRGILKPPPWMYFLCHHTGDRGEGVPAKTTWWLFCGPAFRLSPSSAFPVLTFQSAENRPAREPCYFYFSARGSQVTNYIRMR